MFNRDRLLLFNRSVSDFYTQSITFILGIGICFLFCCLYLFIAIAKVCRREQLSCLFQSAEETVQVYQALELKKPTKCQVKRLSKNLQIYMQDSHFVVADKFDKEKVKNKTINMS